MYLGEYITRVANRIKIDDNSLDERNVPYRQRITDKITEVLREISEAYDWEHLKKTSDLITVANYTSGTVSITNGSSTVTGSATAWTSNMQGRYFQPSTGNNWYKIAYVDATNQILYLTNPMIEATLGGGAYKIWKRFYYVHSSVDRIIDMGNWIQGGELCDTTNDSLADMTPNISNVGQPFNFSMFGIDPYEREYSTGNAIITKDTNIITGSGGTLWLSNVEPGDIFVIGSLSLRVKRVETDTRIISENYANADIPAATNYVVKHDAPIGFQLYYNPDKQYIIPYTYQKKLFALQHDTKDRPDLPDKFDNAILDGVEAGMRRDLKDNDWVNKSKEYQSRIQDLIRRQMTSTPRVRQFKPSIPTRRGY